MRTPGTMQTVAVALESSARVHLICLMMLVAACGTDGPTSRPGSITPSTEPVTEASSQRTAPVPTSASPAGSTTASMSSSGTATTATGSAEVQSILPSFVETWNRMAVIQGRDEWVIGPWLPLRSPSSPENTYGLQVSLGGEPPQLVVDAVATEDRLSRLEVAVLRWNESSVDLLEDAFRIGVMTAVAADDSSQVDLWVTELVERAMQSPADPAEMVELPGGAVAGSFSTDQVYVLGINWSSD